jgi:hypothetical protein
MRRSVTMWNRNLVSVLLIAVAAASLTSACRNQTASTVGPNVSAAPAAPTTPGSAVTEVVNWRGQGFTYPPAPGRGETRLISTSCLSCHSKTDADTMHQPKDGKISCVDCHGGNGALDVRNEQGLAPAPGDAKFQYWKEKAHVQPRYPELWRRRDGTSTSANPQNLFTGSLRESVDYIRFVNPGDLRAAAVACGACHNPGPDHIHIVDNVRRSMMSHGAMLWQAALYNNGAINRRTALYGEAYTIAGAPAEILAKTPPSHSQTIYRGVLPGLLPLPRWEITQPGNILRVFERGGQFRPIIGLQDPLEDSGKPDVKLSVRGFGTDVRTDPVFIGLQKTRLMDPTLNQFGTNDHPGDFRASGCSACHVVYANDRDPVHSAFWSFYGNRGESFSTDRMVNPNPTTTRPYLQPFNQARPTRESGHPIEHRFVLDMPTSTCITCHVHPGTNVLNSYLGYMWWDNESDGQFMYPARQRYPTSDDEYLAHEHNPEGAAVRGLWSDLYPGAADHTGQIAGSDFLENLGSPEFNKKLKNVQFGDFHGHGWVFRKVFKQDRRGNLLDADNSKIDFNDPQKWERAVHLKDIHLEKGMQCVDCHFSQDAHGNGNLYGETRNAVMVDCVDCHGTPEKPSNIMAYLNPPSGISDDDLNKILLSAFTGSAAHPPGLSDGDVIERNKKIIENHFGLDDDGKFIQKSTFLEDGKGNPRTAEAAKAAERSNFPPKSWLLVQTSDTVQPGWRNDDSHAKLARFAHTVRADLSWGNAAAPGEKDPNRIPAHANTRVACYACHSSWNTSCFGCHLPQKANERKNMLHNEGALTRNYTTYDYQTLRDDVYMLGVDSTVRGNKIVPVRSACAVVVSSQDANRNWIYTQQQTVSAEGFSGVAFSPNFPHTVRSTETKQCSDCHVSRDKNGFVNNNAVMAELLMQGTNAANFIGRYAWVAEGDRGLEAVAVTERDEPQAVIGSRLHELAYPDFYRDHRDRNGRLQEAYGHPGTVYDVQLRGEYLYAACGENGFIAYDVAHLDDKGFSERIITAPVSPLGQRLYVNSKFATSICSPSTMAIDPTRAHRPENLEGRITEIGDPSRVFQDGRTVHPLYAYLYLTDREEGLIVIGNPAGSPNKAGVATLLDGDPENNFLQRALTYNPGGLLHGARHIDFYGTLAYVSCDAGMVLLDMDDPLHPRVIPTPQLRILKHPKRIAFQFRYGFVVDDDGVKVIDVTNPTSPRICQYYAPIADARDLYICRTYGYVAAGREGLVILNLERPEDPVRDQTFNASGQINDATAVRVGMTNSSLYAYLADGRNGLRVLQLTGPDISPTYMGFSPRPAPQLIAWYPTAGPALAISEGLDRDRAVDESGNQLSVFGRRGSRPFTFVEQRNLYFHPGKNGVSELFTVTDSPITDPLPPPTSAPATTDQAVPAPP